MRKFLLLFLFFLVLVPHAKAQQFIQSQTAFVATGISNAMNENSNVSYHTITWTVTATVSACTIQIEQSATQTGSYTAIGAAQTCTSSGSYSTNGTGAWVRFNITAITVSGGGSLAVNYYGYTTVPNLGATDGVWTVPLGAGCGLSVPVTGVWAANPASSGTYVGPAYVQAATSELVYQGTTTGAASAVNLNCDITPPTRSTTGKGVTVTGVQLWYGVQTTALTSITAPTVSTVTFPATGAAAAGTVASAGGSLTVLPATLQLATTTSGLCYSENISFGTPVVLNSLNQRLEFLEIFNQTAASAEVIQICGVQVFYTNNQ